MLSTIKVSRKLPEASPPSGWAPFGSASDFGKDMGIAFAVLLIALALAFTAGALIRRHLLFRHRRRHPTVALEKQVTSQLVALPLEAIPAVVFSVRERLRVSGVAECAICLMELADGDAVRVLPNCCHGFHVGCIDVWISSRRSCPTCRKGCMPHTGRLATEGV